MYKDEAYRKKIKENTMDMISKDIGSNADFNNKNDKKINNGNIIGFIIALCLIFSVPAYNLYRTMFSEERVCKAAESAEESSFYKSTGTIVSTNSQVIYNAGEYSIVVVYDVIDNNQMGSRAYKIQRSSGVVCDETRELAYNEDYMSRLDELKVLFEMN